jgi:hypothetical protein
MTSKKIEKTKLIEYVTVSQESKVHKLIEDNINVYVDQFGIIGEDEFLNTDIMSQMLFKIYLCHFESDATLDEKIYVDEYQERILNLVENLREHPVDYIEKVLTYVYDKNAYAIDLIIMSWCLPRLSNFLSEALYCERYKSLITKYNSKLIDIKDSICIKQFCIETLSRKGHVPVHCLDLLWHYITSDMELKISGNEYADFMGIDLDEYDTNNTKIIINMERCLSYGLGNTMNNIGETFNNILTICLNNPISFAAFSKDKNGKNFKNQYDKIKNNPLKYFGKNIDLIM